MSIRKDTTRKFTKKMTLTSLYLLFGIAFLGIILNRTDLPAIIAELGLYSIILSVVYQSVGHLDFRTAKGLPSFYTSLLTLLLTRKPENQPEPEKDSKET